MVSKLLASMGLSSLNLQAMADSFSEMLDEEHGTKSSDQAYTMS